LIPQLFEEGALDALSRLVLVNVIYFKGSWKFPFDPEATRPMTFHIDQVMSFIMVTLG
jgi:serpin B